MCLITVIGQELAFRGVVQHIVHRWTNLMWLGAAVAAILYTGQAESGSPVLAQRLLLDIVGATVIGGTSLFGGRGSIAGTLCGVLFLKLIDNSLNLLDLSHFAIMMVKGAVILLAALVDTLRRRARSPA